MARKILLVLVSAVIFLLIMPFIACNSSNSVANTVSSASATTGQPASPSNSPTTGIIVSPSVKSPWPELEVFTNPLTIIPIEVGKEFNIGLDVNSRLGQYWTAKYDKTTLSLEDEQIAYANPSLPVEGTAWFRFKSISEGNAIITFDLISTSQEAIMRLTYAFFITK